MENKNSIFARLTPAPAPAPSFAPAPAQTPAQAPAQARPEIDARVAGLEASVKAMEVEIAVLKQAAARPVPPAPVNKPDLESAARLARLEKSIEEFGPLLADQAARQKLAGPDGGLKEELGIVNSGISETLAFFESMKRSLSQYASEFSGIERECRKSLGEMQGYIRNIDQKFVTERFDEYLKDSVLQLNGKLALVETEMHAGLSDLSSRLMTSEVLYGKIFTEAEDRLRKGLEPDIQAVNDRLKDLRSKVSWLTDEYSIVMERKMRVLEAKYSAFDAISARMDTISEALKSEKDVPADGRKL